MSQKEYKEPQIYVQVDILYKLQLAQILEFIK